MKIVGCDFHPRWQQVAVFDTETGEINEYKLRNGEGEAEQFYRKLPAPALVGIEACGNSQWFLDLVRGLGHEVWIGDAAEIRASYVRKQKTDRRDSNHILKLLVEKRFPRLWVPTVEQRDLRQLLIHRHKLVEIRTRVKSLQHLAMNRGLQQGSRLCGVRRRAVLKDLPLDGWAGVRRDDLLALLGSLDSQIAGLDLAVEEASLRNRQARLLRTQPGVGPVTALAFVVTIGDVNRFKSSGQLSGLDSARTLFGRQAEAGSDHQARQPVYAPAAGEAVQTTCRLDEGFRKQYQARCHHKPKAVAKVCGVSGDRPHREQLGVLPGRQQAYR